MKKKENIPLEDQRTWVSYTKNMGEEDNRDLSSMSYEDYMELLDVEIDENDEAMKEALSDIEEEYDSETVSDYMKYGV